MYCSALSTVTVSPLVVAHIAWPWIGPGVGFKEVFVPTLSGKLADSVWMEIQP
jgi:hypothetical protein